MRELHGVLKLDWNVFPALKQYALLFDRFHGEQITEMLSNPKPDYIAPHIIADFEFLRDRGIIESVPRMLPEQLTDHREIDVPELVKAMKEELEPWIGVAEQLKKLHSLVLELNDLHMRRLALAISLYEYNADVVPTCKRRLSLSIDGPRLGFVDNSILKIEIEAFPVPNEMCAWQDLLDFRAEVSDKRWSFRRWLHSMTTKHLTEAEVRDEIEWMINKYAKAMVIHRIKSSQSFVDVFVITPLEIIENLVKFDWSKIAKGALQVSKRRVELMEAEMKAPGRECAYVFDARKRFGIVE